MNNTRPKSAIRKREEKKAWQPVADPPWVYSIILTNLNIGAETWQYILSCYKTVFCPLYLSVFHVWLDEVTESSLWSRQQRRGLCRGLDMFLRAFERNHCERSCCFFDLPHLMSSSGRGGKLECCVRKQSSKVVALHDFKLLIYLCFGRYAKLNVWWWHMWAKWHCMCCHVPLKYLVLGVALN